MRHLHFLVWDAGDLIIAPSSTANTYAKAAVPRPGRRGFISGTECTIAVNTATRVKRNAVPPYFTMWKDVDPYIREEMELRDWVTWTPETSEVNGRSVLSWISCEFRKLAEATSESAHSSFLSPANQSSRFTVQAVNPETGLSGYDACTRKVSFLPSALLFSPANNSLRSQYGSSTPRPASTSSTLVMSKVSPLSSSVLSRAQLIFPCASSGTIHPETGRTGFQVRSRQSMPGLLKGSSVANMSFVSDHQGLSEMDSVRVGTASVRMGEFVLVLYKQRGRAEVLVAVN